MGSSTAKLLIPAALACAIVLGVFKGETAYWAVRSFAENKDYCRETRRVTTDKTRIESAIAYVRLADMRSRLFWMSNGRINNTRRIDPETCCTVVHNQRAGDTAITRSSKLWGGPTAFVRFDDLPLLQLPDTKLWVETDVCGRVYKSGGG